MKFTKEILTENADIKYEYFYSKPTQSVCYAHLSGYILKESKEVIITKARTVINFGYEWRYNW